MNSVKCSCNFEHITFEDFFALTLPFPRASTRITHANYLSQCLDEYIKEEEIMEDYYCSKCKRRDRCKKQTVIWRFPPILILQLKRFQVGTWRKEKLDTVVHFPSELDLKKYKGRSSNFHQYV